MKVRLKRRAAVALGLLVIVAWLSASCGGDGDSDEVDPPGNGSDVSATTDPNATVDPNATPDPNVSPTPDATADAAPQVPTLSPERANEELLTMAQNVLFALESAGGLRNACAEPPCSAAVYLSNWETASTRCDRLESYASVKDSSDEGYAGLYNGLEETCASVADAMGELAGETTPEEHKTLAEGAIGDLPSRISVAIGEPD